MPPPRFPLPSEVFGKVAMPGNLQRALWWDRMRIVRNLRSWHARLRDRAMAGDGRNHEGSFVWRTGQSEHVIPFDGRNAQFHALYDDPYRSGYEAETALLLLRLAEGRAVFYDIGSNWGYFSLLLAASPGYEGPIFAFEPNPGPFGDLTRAIASAGLKDRVTGMQTGIGRQRGELRLRLPDRFKSGLGSLHVDGEGPRVPVVSIDELDLPRPDVIKIDAEGMELAILEGAERTLAANRPHVVFESFRDFQRPEVTRAPLEFLAARGYRLFNPALAFSAAGGPILGGYDAPLAELLPNEPRPRTALVPLTPVNRFLMANQINIWACHESRVPGLSPEHFISVAGL